MNTQNSRHALRRFNNLYMAMDEIYHSLARHYGFSDCAFWILYSLREREGCYTQSRLCAMLSLSKQTVNSALKSLESAGYIQLSPIAGNQKSKEVLLTQEGERLTQSTLDEVVRMEENALGQFSPEEQAMLFSLLSAHIRRLDEGARRIVNKEKHS